MSAACVYRFFNTDGDLLYIGQTIDLGVRVRGHESRISWFDEIASATIQHVDSHAEAVAMERDAIERECPRYNLNLQRNVATKRTGRPPGFKIDALAVRRRLMELRRTQSWLTEASGVSPSHLSNIMHGHRASMAKAVDIAQTLGVAMWEIFPEFEEAAA
jgi:hypothetical protein